jgi:predicted O-linked N-acetylglucosamine transferase (SPINDLY family)
MAPVIEAHDRSRFEIIGVSFGPEEDGGVAGRIAAACDSFHDVRALSDEAVARLLFDLETDIAVDLIGHTGLARPGVLARRPAPVQAAYLGYPGTLGAPYMDHIVADAAVIPAGDEAYYDEAVVRLPGCYLAGERTPPSAAEKPGRAEAGLPETGFVFACFNASWKIAPEVFDVWMRLLAKTPGSVLWLHRDGARPEENLRREAAARGVDARRLIFKDRVAFDRHMALHGLADLFLDTLPYNAHATALDALAAGLPVLTCRGSAFAGRVGASLLQAAGLPELIAPDLAAYEAMALRLARAPGELAQIRARLAEARETSPLFDSAAFTRNLEEAFEAMWRG